VSFQSLSAELAGNLPGLSPLLAAKYINYAWRDVRDARLWSFFLKEDAVATPAQITSGTLAIVQFTNTVTADATASAAIAAIGTSVEIPYTYLSFRLGGSGSTSQIYNIVDVDSTVPTALVFTLDRVIMEATAAASGYICYRPYIIAPQADFLRWDAFVDMTNGWDLNKKCTSRDFDKSDPQRQAYGQAYNIGFSRSSDDVPPVPVYELWPGPTEGQTFYVRYQIRGVDFSSPTDVQPYGIPDQLILQTALASYAYPWAQMNAGAFPRLAKVNWAQMIEQARQLIHGKPGSNRPGLLQAAIRQDDNQATRSVLKRGHRLRARSLGAPFPVDANFIQSHLVNL
jgi:hypothetical protein